MLDAHLKEKIRSGIEQVEGGIRERYTEEQVDEVVPPDTRLSVNYHWDLGVIDSPRPTRVMRRALTDVDSWNLTQDYKIQIAYEIGLIRGLNHIKKLIDDYETTLDAEEERKSIKDSRRRLKIRINQWLKNINRADDLLASIVDKETRAFRDAKSLIRTTIQDMEITE